MSDGNFNRALLPKNELGAGLRAGKAKKRQTASEAFDAVMNEFPTDTPDKKLQEMKNKFMELLR